MLHYLTARSGLGLFDHFPSVTEGEITPQSGVLTHGLKARQHSPTRVFPDRTMRQHYCPRSRPHLNLRAICLSLLGLRGQERPEATLG